MKVRELIGRLEDEGLDNIVTDEFGNDLSNVTTRTYDEGEKEGLISVVLEFDQ
jgi:hypothetical protein